MNTKDKIKKAAALTYNLGDTAPKITALGRGETADRIISTAEKSNIPIYKDERLANTLLDFEIGSEIPPELYEVVAEILVFISNIDKFKELRDE